MQTVTTRKTWQVATAVLLAALLFMSWTAQQASANHQPADKPFASAAKLTKFTSGSNVTLLTATVKNSKPADMMLLLSMECSIVTDVIIPGSTTGGTTQTSSARGQIRTWIEIDNQTVPIVSSSSPPQTPVPGTPNSEDGKVTMCDRLHERTVKDTESPQNGIDYSKDYQDTKSSNAFNWVRLNMGSGIHTITVKADFIYTATGTSTASGYVGARSLVGIPGKFANDATISETGT